MTMHLARGLSSINTRKPKQKKLTQAQQQKLVIEHRAYNKRMKQLHSHDLCMTFDEYVDYVFGRKKSQTKPERQVATEVKSFDPFANTFRRTTQDIPSADTMKGIAAKPEPKKYTGTLIKGIATMHKSNAVPVINDEEAKSISQMRRN